MSRSSRDMLRAITDKRRTLNGCPLTATLFAKIGNTGGGPTGAVCCVGRLGGWPSGGRRDEGPPRQLLVLPLEPRLTGSLAAA